MAKLSANGTEVARFKRVQLTPDGQVAYAVFVSYRSNGWLLKKFSGEGWKQYGKVGQVAVEKLAEVLRARGYQEVAS
jgi:hypothetical protein